MRLKTNREAQGTREAHRFLDDATAAWQGVDANESAVSARAGVLKLSYEIQKFETKGIHLEPGLIFMPATLVSQINGCSFCVDISRAMAIREHLGMETFNALSEYRNSPLFSDRSARR
jgi:alkylhydroperoxidase family enzyme